MSAKAPPLLGRWREAFEIYVAEDPESAWIRGHHLASIRDLTPYLMLANVINGALVAVLARPETRGLFYAWGGSLLFLVAMAMRGWWRSRGRAVGPASVRAAQRNTHHAAALGTLWGLVPLIWFPGASPPAQLLIGTLTAGMMSAGAFALSPMPKASIAYVLPLLAGALASLMESEHALNAVLSVLLCAYAGTCIVGAVSSARQAAALLRSERESVRQQEIVTLLLRDFEEHASEALWETDPELRLTHVSPRLCQWLSADTEALVGRALPSLLSERGVEGADALRAAMSQARPFRELTLRSGEDAQERWWALSGKPSYRGDRSLAGWRGVVVDVSIEHRAQRQLVQLAHFDSLTGLVNRHKLHEVVREQLERCTGGALLSIDLDHFKAINDSLGHSVGDAVLSSVSERLRSMVRAEDVVARLGGDEFAIVVRETISAEGALALARRLIDAFAEPCTVDGRRLRVGLSVGVAVLQQHGGDLDELLGHVDLALYEAKGSGRGRAALFTPEMGERSRRRRLIERELRHAVERNELRLAWQPRVDLRTWTITGAEGLLRWRHPSLGEVSPGEFIPIAEQSGSINSLGTWVLREACRAGTRGLEKITLSVNVSSMQLHGGGFDALVRDILASSGMPSRRLEIELTESVFVDGVQATLASLRALQTVGVRVALDDFGTGYSSLSYLRRFPFDTLKIDRSFVGEVPTRADAHALVGTMVSMAGALGMIAVAEGVETKEQLDQLASLGCREIQGYFISKPVPEVDLKKLIAGWDAAPLEREKPGASAAPDPRASEQAQ